MIDARNGGVFVLPDILCNAGGVIVSYFEWVQEQYFWDEDEVNGRLRRALDRSPHRLLELAQARNLSHRHAALAIGVDTVRKVKQTRGLFP